MYFTKTVEADVTKEQCKQFNKLLSLGSYKPKLETVSDSKGSRTSCHKELHGLYLKRVIIDEVELHKCLEKRWRLRRHWRITSCRILSRRRWPRRSVAVSGRQWSRAERCQRIDKFITHLIIDDISEILGLVYLVYLADILSAFLYPNGMWRHFNRSTIYIAPLPALERVLRKHQHPQMMMVTTTMMMTMMMMKTMMMVTILKVMVMITMVTVCGWVDEGGRVYKN